MREKISSRLSGRQGFTLAELMVAILVMLMVTSIVASGIPLAANALGKVVDAANARALLSTTATALRTELSTASLKPRSDGDTGGAVHAVGVAADHKSVTYTSRETGSVCTISSAEGSSIRITDPMVTVRDETTGAYTTARSLVSDQAATKNLTTRFDSITYHAATRCFTVTHLQVMKEGRAVAELPELVIRDIAP